LLTTENRRFIEGQLDSVNGWLTPDASYLTSALLNLQQEKGIQGPVFENGVWVHSDLVLATSIVEERGIIGIDDFLNPYPFANI